MPLVIFGIFWPLFSIILLFVETVFWQTCSCVCVGNLELTVCSRLALQVRGISARGFCRKFGSFVQRCA